MKVRVVANELVDTDIEMVSLVRHGANRAPFKILKCEDDSPPATLGDKLQSFFSLSKGEVAVTAYFIRKDAAEALLPILKAEGVDTSQADETEGVVRIPVSDAPSKGFVQLADALAVALSHPVREFSDESIVKAYTESAGLTGPGFAPGVKLAVSSLADAVWSLLNSGEDTGARDERVAKVDTLLASFRKYVTALSRMLPEQVFKVEAAAQAVHTEETDMPKGKLEEAMAGDLDGLLKSDAPTPEPTPAPQAATPAPVVKDEDPPPAAPPAADPNEALLAALQKALEPITAKLDNLTKAVETQQSVTDSLAAEIADAKDTLEKAEAVTRRTTLVDRGGDMDLALSTLGGSDHGSPRKRQVAKSGEELWDGLFSDLDTFRPSR